MSFDGNWTFKYKMEILNNKLRKFAVCYYLTKKLPELNLQNTKQYLVSVEKPQGTW